jgi:hypothetical protein
VDGSAPFEKARVARELDAQAQKPLPMPTDQRPTVVWPVPQDAIVASRLPLP